MPGAVATGLPYLLFDIAAFAILIIICHVCED
jgi:hypothetical protein